MWRDDVKMVRCIFQIGLEYAPFGVKKHLQLLRQMVMKNDLLPYKLLSKIQSQACYRYKKRVKEKWDLCNFFRTNALFKIESHNLFDIAQFLLVRYSILRQETTKRGRCVGERCLFFCRHVRVRFFAVILWS